MTMLLGSVDAARSEISRLHSIRIKQAAEIERLHRLIGQMAGMAREGCVAPATSSRWCERIDEVAHCGPLAEYDEYSRAAPALSSKVEE
jgi:hypothetical protein